MSDTEQLANAVARASDFLAALQKYADDSPSSTRPALERIRSVSAPGEDAEHTLTVTDLKLILQAARWALAEQEWRA